MAEPYRESPGTAASGDVLLRVEDLHVSYGAITALRGVSLEVRRGQIVTLIGANGAGKTTTLRAVSGLVRARQGRVVFDGRDIAGMRPDQIVQELGIAHAPEGRGIFANLTVRENLALGAYGLDDRRLLDEGLERAFRRFPILKERYGQAAGTLSGGEQQMLAISRALIRKPRLLLLDEPSLGLAPQIVQTIFSIIGEINREGTTILLVEQNARQALAVAHDAYVLEVGCVAMHDRANVLLHSDAVRKAYLGVHDAA
jgi:branched-chain amino acid transport system ATP-binding protein